MVAGTVPSGTAPWWEERHSVVRRKNVWLASRHAVPGGRLAKLLKGGKGGPAEDSLKNDALKATSSATSLWNK